MYEFKSCRSRKAGEKSQPFASDLAAAGNVSEIQPGLVMRGRGDGGRLVSILGLENFAFGQVNSAKVVRSTVFRHGA